MELGRLAAMSTVKRADENLGARPAAPAVAPKPPVVPKPAPTANLSMTMPRPPVAPQPAGGMLGGIGQHVQNYFRNPTNMAQVIGASGDVGRGILGATGAPGLFAISNLARGGGEMGSILRGGIPNGNTPPAQGTS